MIATTTIGVFTGDAPPDTHLHTNGIVEIDLAGVKINLGNHSDPALWLDNAAHALSVLAEQVRAAREQVSA